MNSTRSLEFTSYVPENPSRLKRFVAPLLESLAKKDLSYTITDRRTALRHLERLFNTHWHGPVPHAPLVFTPPMAGRAAEEFVHEDDPVRTFRDQGPVGWNRRLQAYFNGWKISSTDELRMAALAHEFGHLLFGQATLPHLLALQEALQKQNKVFNAMAYTCASEGVATFGEREWLRASAYVPPKLKKAWKAIKEAVSSFVAKFREPKPEPEECNVDAHLLGTRFFDYVSERIGVGAAFNLIASNLPEDMVEIERPETYLERTIRGYGRTN